MLNNVVYDKFCQKKLLYVISSRRKTHNILHNTSFAKNGLNLEAENIRKNKSSYSLIPFYLQMKLFVFFSVVMMFSVDSFFFTVIILTVIRLKTCHIERIFQTMWQFNTSCD